MSEKTIFVDFHVHTMGDGGVQNPTDILKRFVLTAERQKTMWFSTNHTSFANLPLENSPEMNGWYWRHGLEKYRPGPGVEINAIGGIPQKSISTRNSPTSVPRDYSQKINHTLLISSNQLSIQRVVDIALSHPNNNIPLSFLIRNIPDDVFIIIPHPFDDQSQGRFPNVSYRFTQLEELFEIARFRRSLLGFEISTGSTNPLKLFEARKGFAEKYAGLFVPLASSDSHKIPDFAQKRSLMVSLYGKAPQTHQLIIDYLKNRRDNPPRQSVFETVIPLSSPNLPLPTFIEKTWQFVRRHT